MHRSCKGTGFTNVFSLMKLHKCFLANDAYLEDLQMFSIVKIMLIQVNNSLRGFNKEKHNNGHGRK